MLTTEYTILFDISQLLSAAYLGGHKKIVEEEGHTLEYFENVVRNKTFTSLYYHCKNFRIAPDKMILAIDSSDNWRYDFFPHYKAKRKEGRVLDTMDHKKRYAFFDNFIQELIDVFAFQGIKETRCEADDVIGTIALEHDAQKLCVILSRDHDFLQLIRRNVKIYDWFTKQWSTSYFLKKDKDISKTIEWKIKTENDAIQMMKYQILYGDSGDSVPNILSDDDVFINPLKRKKLFGPVGITKKYFTGDVDKDLIAWKEIHHNQTENFKRNVRMMDLRYVPTVHKTNILNKFINLQDKKVDLDEVNDYCFQHELYEMVDKIKRFYKRNV